MPAAILEKISEIILVKIPVRKTHGNIARIIIGRISKGLVGTFIAESLVLFQEESLEELLKE